MDKTKKLPETGDKQTIWKQAHTPLKDRTTSSGVTFWPKKVKKNE